jgi:hypothetical protein
MCLIAFHFLKKAVIYMISDKKSREPQKCSRAALRCLVGHIWLAGRKLSRLDLNTSIKPSSLMLDLLKNILFESVVNIRV